MTTARGQGELNYTAKQHLDIAYNYLTMLLTVVGSRPGYVTEFVAEFTSGFAFPGDLSPRHAWLAESAAESDFGGIWSLVVLVFWTFKLSN